MSKKATQILDDCETEPKIVANMKWTKPAINVDGTILIVDLTQPGEFFPNLYLFFVGEIDGLVGV
jgi:hypothetical protein